MTTECRWRPQKVVAALISVVMVLVPVIAAVVAGTVLAKVLPTPLTTLGVVLWWTAVIGGSFFAAWLADSVMRRFAPIPGLWRMTMVFPDRAPSRFGIALRATNVSELRRRIASAEENKDLATSAETILALATALSSHDRKTRGHSERTRAYTDLIAEELGLSHSDQDRLRWAALLHDIGKLEIPEHVLNKSGPLTDEEFAQIKRHPLVGMKLASPLVPWLGSWADTIAHHHEKWDGSGYPTGLRGDDISLGGRIVAVADAYDVMTSGRSYQTAKSPEAARQEVMSMAGSQFDPRVARALMSVSIGKLIWLRPLGWFASLPFVGGIDKFLRDMGNVGAAAAVMLVLLVSGALGDGPPVLGETTTTIAAGDESPESDRGSQGGGGPGGDSSQGGNGSGNGDGSGNGSGDTNPPPSSSSTTTSLPPPTPPHTTRPTTTTETPGSTFPIDITTSTSSTTTSSSTTTTTPSSTTAPVITVSPPPTTIPVMLNPDSNLVLSGNSGRINVLANDIGDGLRLRELMNPTTSVASIDTDLGTAEIVSDDTIAYRAKPNVSGTDVFDYRVCDRFDTCDTSTVTVNIEPQPRPVMKPDQATVTAGETVTVDVLANDNGDRLRVARIARPPKSGKATVSGNGETVEYTPAPNSPEAVEFEYEACDRDGDCSRARVTVTIDTPPGPRPQPDQAEVEAAETVVIPVLDNDRGQGLRIESVDQDSRKFGRATITDDRRRIRYEAKQHSGKDRFTYTVCDRYGSCATTRVNVTVTKKSLPVVANPDEAEVEIGGSVVIDVIANDTGDALILDSIVETPSKGKATITTKGRIRYRSDGDRPGDDRFTYRVCDGDGDCAEAEVRMKIRKQDTHLKPDRATVDAGEEVMIEVLANDETEQLEIDALPSNPSLGRARIFQKSRVRYTAYPNRTGDDVFEYRACNRHQVCATAEITVKVNPQPSPQTKPDIGEVRVDQTTEIYVLGNDNGDRLRVKATRRDKGRASVSDYSRVKYTGMTPATDRFEYQVCDREGDCVWEDITVKVTGNHRPVAVDDVTDAVPGATRLFDVLANDNNRDGDRLTVRITTRPSYVHARVIGNRIRIDLSQKRRNPPWHRNSDLIVYKVCDSDGLCDTADLLVRLTRRWDTGSPTATETPSGWWARDPLVGRKYTTEDPIRRTADDSVYRSEQFGPRNGPFEYVFPVRSGLWRVRLHLAEIWWEEDGRRVFNVYANDRLVLENVDIHSEAGANTTLVKEFTVNMGILDQDLDLRFDASTDNPSVVGIELTPAHEINFDLMDRLRTREQGNNGQDDIDQGEPGQGNRGQGNRGQGRNRGRP